MIGVEGKAYLVVLRTALGRVGYREFEPRVYRIRVEPFARTKQVSDLLTQQDWKQPGDGNQNRFSAEVRLQELPRMLAVAMRALRAGGPDTEFNHQAPDWARQLARIAEHPVSNQISTEHASGNPP
jgi:hypothetical protein